MIVLLRRRYVMAAAVTLLAAAAAAALWAGPSARPAMAGTGRQTIVLDAGHGGEDGGAVSRDGVAESSVNLAITRKLRDVFLFLGRDTVLTREGEEAIYSPDCVTLREKKVSDLKNRVALINQQSGAVLISIHQNSMPDHPSVHGAQVFYNAVSPGGELGMTVQGALNGAVNAGNEKNGIGERGSEKWEITERQNRKRSGKRSVTVRSQNRQPECAGDTHRQTL